MKSFKEYLIEKEKVISQEIWVSKSDAKTAVKVMKELGIKSEKSGQKISGMEVWTIKATKFEAEVIQIELADKDINSWLEGKKNK